MIVKVVVVVVAVFNVVDVVVVVVNVVVDVIFDRVLEDYRLTTVLSEFYYLPKFQVIAAQRRRYFILFF